MNPTVTLDQNDLKAIELKFLGSSYQEISVQVGVAVGTVKSWFMRSGRLYRPYALYAVEESKEGRDRAARIYAGSLEKAVRVMNQLLNSDDEKMRFVAAKEIIRQATLDANPVTTDEMQEIKLTDIMMAIKRRRDEEQRQKLAVTNMQPA